MHIQHSSCEARDIADGGREEESEREMRERLTTLGSQP
jgi:hypothetical protein